VATLNPEIERDCKTLRSIADGVEELRSHVLAMQHSQGARERGYFLPNEDDEVRRILVAYRNYRAAAFDIINRSRRYQEYPERHDQLAAFLVGFGAGVMLFNWSRFLVHRYEDVPFIRAKLNEADSRFGIGEGFFEEIRDNLTRADTLAELRDAVSFFLAHSADIAEAIAEAPEDLVWLESAVYRQCEEVRLSWPRIIASQARLEWRELRRDSLAPLTFGNIWLEHKPSIPDEHQQRFIEIMQPGDFFIVRPDNKASTVFLPGWWTHAAMYFGGKTGLEKIGATELPNIQRSITRLETADHPDVIEALAAGIVLNPLHRSMHVDHAVVLRPRLDSPEMLQAINDAFSHLDKGYDFDFDFSRSDRLVCTELIYRSMHDKGHIHFQPTLRLGKPTLSADDIVRYVLDQQQYANPTVECLAISLKDGAHSTLNEGKAALQRLRRTMEE
jgi:hypothetical protein